MAKLRRHSAKGIESPDRGLSRSRRGSSESLLTNGRSRHLEALINSAQDAVIGVDLNRIVWACNPAVHTLFGVVASKLVGASVDRLPLADGHSWEELLDESRCREAPLQTEVHFQSRQGAGAIVVCLSVSPIYLEAGCIDGFSVVARDVTEQATARDRLRLSLSEKESLLKEIHHRVKNNLQVISSLLRLQASYLEEGIEREMFLSSERRVLCMALVHERLCRSRDFSRVQFSEYVRELARQLHLALAPSGVMVEQRLVLDSVELPIDRAVPCGLILSELIGNSYLYAYSSRRDGVLEITLRRVRDRVSLTVADDGCGLPQGVIPETSPTLGFRVINTLVQQLRGAIRTASGPGTSFTIDFEIEKPRVYGVRHDRNIDSRV